RHVVEVELRRLDLLGVLLGEVAQRHDIGMAVERVVVEADLRVEADQLARLGDHSGLISSSDMSLGTKAANSCATTPSACLARSPVSPSAWATRRPWCGSTPVAGSTEKVTIFSGVSCATCSMSMPPAVDTTKATREVARSTSAER